MATVIYSPLVTDMRGKLGDAVMSIWKGIHYVRSRVIPSNPQTAAQTLQRDALKNTLTMWQSVKSWAKTIWDTYAEGYALSGYNRYMDDNILLVKAGTAGSLTPFNPDYIKISGLAIAAAGAGEIDCSWTNDTGVSPTDQVWSYYRKTETAAEEYAWTAGPRVPAIEEVCEISGLDTGEEYEVAFFCGLNPCTEAQESYNEVLLAG